MGSGTRKSYSREFKINAVKLVTGKGLRASEVARDLGINENLIYNWRKKYLEDQAESFPGNGNLKSKDEYIRKLEEENKRLKDERDILKKAAQFFAREP